MKLIRTSVALCLLLLVLGLIALAVDPTLTTTVQAHPVDPPAEHDDNHLRDEHAHEEGEHEREGRHEHEREGRHEHEHAFDRDRERDYEEEREREREHEHREMEEAMELEFHHRALEANLRSLDEVVRLTEIASDTNLAAGYAILRIEDLIERDDAIEILEEATKSQEKAVRNLAKMKLLDIYAEEENRAKVRKTLRSLIN